MDGNFFHFLCTSSLVFIVFLTIEEYLKKTIHCIAGLGCQALHLWTHACLEKQISECVFLLSGIILSYILTPYDNRIADHHLSYFYFLGSS